MPICGLSNQWKTREGLLEIFAEGPTGSVEDYDVMRVEKIRSLLFALDSQPSRVFFIGTSHSQMNICNRDVVRMDDRVQPFAYIEIVRLPDSVPGLQYRIELRRVFRNRPTLDWVVSMRKNVDDVVSALVEAFDYADIPPLRELGKSSLGE